MPRYNARHEKTSITHSSPDRLWDARAATHFNGFTQPHAASCLGHTGSCFDSFACSLRDSR